MTEQSDQDPNEVLMNRPDQAMRDSVIRVLRRLEDGLSSVRWLLWGIFLTMVFSLSISVFIVIWSLLHVAHQ